METRANNALIGLFTLAVIAAAFGFVYWFARAADNATVQHYRVVFSGSITGLSVGSSVLFNGIRVGQIDTLELMPENPSTVVARISVKQGTPVKIDTRARLEFQGLTGGAYVQLSGGTSAAPALLSDVDGADPTLYAERSEFQNLVDGTRDTVTKAAQTLARIDEWLRVNQQDLTNTVQNINSFTKTLSNNSDNITELLKSASEASKNISVLSANFSGMSDDIHAVIKAVDAEKINTAVNSVVDASTGIDNFVKSLDAKKIDATLANVQAFSQTLADAREPLQSFATKAASLTAKLDEMAPKLSESLDGINKITTAVDPAAVSRTVANIDKVTAAFGDNATDIEAVIKDTRTLAASLAAMTPKLETAFDGIEKLAKSVDGEKIGRVIDNADKFAASLGGNTDAVNGFIKDASEFGRKLNATADRLDGVMKNIEAMTTSPDGKGLFAEITATSKAIRELAINLDSRTAEITRSISQFAGSGLRDYQSLAVDGQKTLKSLDRVLNNLQRDPQQVLFGPRATIPEYRGK